MKFKAVTNDRRQIELNWDAINVYLSRYKPGTPIDVEITRKVKRKSDPMRKWYWSTVLPTFAKGLGYDPDEYELFHRQLKITFFQIKPDDKGIHRKVPHVFADESDIPVPGKKEFLDWVMRKAALEGIYIETPDER